MRNLLKAVIAGALGALSIAGPSAAGASDYWLAGLATDGEYVIYIDMATLTTQPNGHLRYWTTAIYDDGHIARTHVTYQRTQMEVDCQGETWRLVQLTQYDAGDKVLASIPEDDSDPMQALGPRSVQFYIQRFVCDPNYAGSGYHHPGDASASQLLVDGRAQIALIKSGAYDKR